MSLRSDVMFVTSIIGKAIRQILGETFKNIADYLLYEGKDTGYQPETFKVQVAPTPVRSNSNRKSNPKSKSRIAVSNTDPLPEPQPEVDETPEKPVKVRDRSTYNPRDHNSYKIAAIGVLKVLIEQGSSMSAPAIHKYCPNSTSSTIRIACKIMVSDEILGVGYDDEIRSNVYCIADQNAAKSYLAELEAMAPELPSSDESGEPQPSL